MLQSLRMHSCHRVPGPLITLQLELTFLHSKCLLPCDLWAVVRKSRMSVPTHWVDEEATSLADSDTWPQLHVVCWFCS